MNTPTPFAFMPVLLPALATIATLAAAGAAAQEIDNTQILPDAQPGDCFAKVITPAKFSTRSEEVVVQEASERIETVPAEYETIERTVVVKEAAREIEFVPTEYEERSERIETRPAETFWVAKGSEEDLPASPGALEGIERSGVDLASVEPEQCFREYFTPAEYESGERRVMVKEASARIETTPPVYETVEERVLVKEASSQVVDVPAVYRTESESVLVEPARSVWKTDCGIIERVENTTGDVMCLVEVPARYETLTRTVLDEPASTKTISVPAEYETMEVQRLLSPATERRIEIPARTKTVTSQVQSAPSRLEWRKVLCEANMTRDIITSLQRALKREGFDPGPIDGVAGQTTMRAIERYQTEQDLDRGGITYETLQKLEVQS